MSTTTAKRIDANSLNLKEQVVSINRVTKVVKGGKNMSFSALVVVGDPGAKIVGFGTGKAKEVPAAIKKGIEAAKKNLRKIHVLATTIQHPVLGEFGSGRVLLKPAPAGTGVIAGGPVRAVIQAVGIPNVLTKSIGSHNPHNVVKATIDALEAAARQGRSGRAARPGTGEGGIIYMAGTIKIKLIRQPHLHAGKAQSDCAGAGSEEDEPHRGASGYAGVPRHGEEDSAPAGDRRLESVESEEDSYESQSTKTARGPKAQEAAHRPGHGHRPR